MVENCKKRWTKILISVVKKNPWRALPSLGSVFPLVPSGPYTELPCHRTFYLLGQIFAAPLSRLFQLETGLKEEFF